MPFRSLYRRFAQRLSEIELRELDPIFEPDELGTTPAAEAIIFGGDGVAASTTDREAWILAALSKGAQLLFEFGTATGRTAYLWARNSPPGAEVVTLTLPPGERDSYAHAGSDSRRDRRHALRQSRFADFRYHGTNVEHKVTQHLADSKSFDEAPYHGRCDLIFVDGSHAYSYVQSDTEKALRMIRPGGLLLWHDYGRSSGVNRSLHELATTFPVARLRGTSLAAYRAPREGLREG